MKLIKYKNFNIEIAEEAYLVGPIRKLFTQDRTKSKETFFKQMSLLYFIYDPRSNYAYITNESDRIDEVEAQEGISKKDSKKYWTPEFKAAREVYKNLTKSSSTELLQDTRMQIDNIRMVLKSIDYTNMEEKDKVNAVKTLTTIVGMIPKLVKDLSEAEKAVAKEIEEQSKARGNSEMSLFDNGINVE